MEVDLMMKTALALLTITALGGLTMAIVRLFYEVNPPAWLAMLHGLLAAGALTLLIYAQFAVGLPGPAVAALVIFLIVAGAGAYLNLNYHANRVPLPKLFLLGHGIGGIAGYVLLVMAVWR